ncbi:hypothetical protein CK203_061087 [Vitis vinifera]|uniref:Uncharacterized protein n=1 Tax=Vitis vinifera TaxID=29760 RepID=A0A438G9V6_VITVI|nr:hypothetical protein CK203_061087 [Vitis vinifera]
MASRKTPREWEQAIQVLKSYPTKFSGEGFLEKFADIYEARNQREEIIRSLKLACLLEGDVLKGRCKMHDVIRDMALCIHEYKKGTYRAEKLDKTEMFSMILYTGRDIKEYEKGHVQLSTEAAEVHMTSSDEHVLGFEGGGDATFDFAKTELALI